MNLLNEKLGVIRRQKAIYVKKLSDETNGKQQLILKGKIQALIDEEKYILEQLKYD